METSNLIQFENTTIIEDVVKASYNRRPLHVGAPDDWSTPDWATDVILKYVKPKSHIWEPCCGQQKMSNRMADQGHYVFATDISMKVDFLEQPEVPPGTDYIITNPPYSTKTQFIEKCYQLGKPWALLLPVTSLEGVKRQKMFDEHGVQVILLPRRVKFERFDWIEKNSSPQYAVAWFTHGFDLPSDIVFEGGW